MKMLMNEMPKNSPRTPPIEMMKSIGVLTVRLKYRLKGNKLIFLLGLIRKLRHSTLKGVKDLLTLHASKKNSVQKV